MSLYEELRTVEDVQALIDDGIRESETLEYKTASHRIGQSDYRELGKDVSAFANTVGGVIVYGVATHKGDETLPAKLEPIRPENIASLHRALATYVRPPIAGVRWKTLPEGSEATCLIVDVPQSFEAPHQVAVEDHRYYRRFGPESKPITHDLVELLFTRRRGPDLELIAECLGGGHDVPPPWRGPFHLRFSLLNRGPVPARHALFLIRFDRSTDLAVRGGAGLNAQRGADSRGRWFFEFRSPVGVLYPALAERVFTIACDFQSSLIEDGQPFASVLLMAEGMTARGVRLTAAPDSFDGVDLVTNPLNSEELQEFLDNAAELEPPRRRG